MGCQKLGQPVCESYFAFELKTGRSQQTQRKVPRRCSSVSGLEPGASVPFFRVTSYCSGVKSRRHSSSDLTTLPTTSAFARPLSVARTSRAAKAPSASADVRKFRLFMEYNLSRQ